MSQTFFCPTCRIPIAELPLAAPAACPRCGQTYWYPNRPQQAKPVRPVSPPPPPEASSQSGGDEFRSINWAPSPEKPASSGPSVTERFHSATQRRFRPATSWGDLFDLKFQKYVTPLIVRFTWITALVWTALALLAILVGTLAALAPDMESGGGAGLSFHADGGGGLFSQLPDWFTERAAFVLVALVQFCLTLLALLWVRVLLETVIVVFNIATTLNAMEEKLASSKK